METRIIVAADHRGYWLKEHMMASSHVGDISIRWSDAGAYTPERSDYTEHGIYACHRLLEDKADYALLICGTGTGMAMLANRYRYIYAGVAWNPEIARHGKEDDNLNVLALPADWLSREDAEAIVHAWLAAHFKKGRYADRVAMIDAI